MDKRENEVEKKKEEEEKEDPVRTGIANVLRKKYPGENWVPSALFPSSR